MVKFILYKIRNLKAYEIPLPTANLDTHAKSYMQKDDHKNN